jgi:hypothetical protein
MAAAAAVTAAAASFNDNSQGETASSELGGMH